LSRRRCGSPRRQYGLFFEVARKAGVRVYDGRFHDDLDDLRRFSRLLHGLSATS